MDSSHFDGLTRSLAKSRRLLLGGALALAGGGLGVANADGRKKHKNKRKRDKRPKPNAFGCLDVGAACKRSEQCCSGICEGKKGKRKCAAHDTSVCNADSDICAAGQGGQCGIYNANCLCVSTTGAAPFCGDFTTPSILCRECSQDMDCEEEFGLGAACVVYGGVCASYCPHTGGASCLPACNDSTE
jgi:hypothetical protein